MRPTESNLVGAKEPSGISGNLFNSFHLQRALEMMNVELNHDRIKDLPKAKCLSECRFANPRYSGRCSWIVVKRLRIVIKN